MHRLAIIGGGFCGLMVMTHLVEQANEDLQVTWIDSALNKGIGVAYQNICEDYVLNVPAANMGAYPDKINDFLNWLNQHYPDKFQGSDFVPRSLYGDYLQTIYQSLMEKVEKSPSTIHQITARALDLNKSETGIVLTLSNQETIEVDQVILAHGNFIPRNLSLTDSHLADVKHYFQNPWQSQAIEDLDPHKKLFLLGSGLTMIDIVLGVRAQGYTGQIIALSPHGYAPVSHQKVPVWPDFLKEQVWPSRLSGWLRLVRQQIKLAEQQDINWRAVIDAIRPYNSQIWQTLPESERRRFLRHFRHRWGVLRHRLPMQTAEVIQAEIETGSLEILAGKLIHVQDNNYGLNVQWQDRQSAEVKSCEVQRLINCTGPNCNYDEIPDPLISSLRNQGLLQADPLRIGILTNAQGAIIDQNGDASNQIFTLGAALRPFYWESTAVPELRQQAKGLSDYLISQISAP